MSQTTNSTASYHCDGKTFDLYVVQRDDLADPAPGVLLAPAWDGLNAPLKERADKLANLGFVAVAVDLYGAGIRGEPLGDNSALMKPLLEDRLLIARRMASALAAIQGLAFVDPEKVAAVGYCFGGLCVLDLARTVPRGLKGVFSIHGVLTPNGLEQTLPIDARVVIEHGWEDPAAPREDLLAFADEMTRRGADWTIHVHGHAMHAFSFEAAQMPERGLQYHPLAARRSQGSLERFLIEVLAES